MANWTKADERRRQKALEREALNRRLLNEWQLAERIWISWASRNAKPPGRRSRLVRARVGDVPVRINLRRALPQPHLDVEIDPASELGRELLEWVKSRTAPGQLERELLTY